jgi:hypothetical protein
MAAFTHFLAFIAGMVCVLLLWVIASVILLIRGDDEEPEDQDDPYDGCPLHGGRGAPGYHG